MNESVNLTPEAKLAVEAYVRGLVGRWLTWLGAVNVLALGGMLSYVMFLLPERASDRVLTLSNQRVANWTEQLEKRFADVFILSGKVESSYDALNKRASQIGAEVDKLQADHKARAGAVPRDPQAPAAAASAPLPSADALERTLASLGARRDGPTFTINNPRMGGADAADCPPGTFVYRVHASGAVGGNYAVDGISQLKVSCSPIR